MDICAEIQGTIELLKSYQEIYAQSSDALIFLDKHKIKNKKTFKKVKIDLAKSDKYDKLISSTELPIKNGGIYLFKFKEDTCDIKKEKIKDIYENEKAKKVKKLPQLNGDVKSEYIYIGKSEKDIINRIKEHVEKSSNNTYAMNLGLFKNEEIRDHLELIIYFLEETADYPEKFILSLLKKELHEKYEPMIGGSRT